MGFSLNSLRIGARLGVGFGILLILLCAVGGFATFEASRLNDKTVDLADNWLVGTRTLGDVRAAENGVRRTSLRFVLETDAAKKQTLHAAHEAAQQQFETAMSAYEKTIDGADETQLAQRIRSTWSDYLTTDKQMLALSEANNVAAADALATGDTSVTFNTAMDAISKDVAFQTQGANAARNEASSTYHTALVAIGVAIALAVVIGIVTAAVIARSIVEPMQKAVAVAQTVANGDLTSHIDAHGSDEAAQLLGALKQMNTNLANLIGQVRNGSETIATGASQIATGNTDLSSRTEEQAASLEETAASMEELTATVRQNTESAKQGNTLAANASEVAARGGEVVGRVVHTMREISESSAKVADIISTIEGIAFQTNILALNAAVEAARAGEQGRGFAVVAGEVRSLAQRAATAAKEIKELINESVDRVTTGTEQVDEAGRTINEVVSAVRRVTDLMGEIAAASNEQHKGIEQVNSAVVQMDQVTQQNAALVEQASAAAQSMAEQARGLRDAVSVFKVSTAHAAFAGTASVAPRRQAMPANKASVAPVRSVPRVAMKSVVAAEAVKPVEQSDESWETF
ncbi:methyl-accepting chemotaxis protein [Paraburkholderia dinghuensis]|uniref:Methyl-accepting chemotaxis protein n=1 Tax=Paraburkholderia dinghuensis TaxID=2305225 RepID=A0A3N6Q0Q1_9BURK|nr:methyl-accepting chemotaxis protein [Paraburkholderia dinghuensis]RQH08510.1 methyl-accepting chemotaxis protein [Paraburkholderia dinghuensis]